MDREFTKAELYEEPFPWTIICGQVYAIGDFLASHPGGALIRRAIGEDATDMFLAHHGPKSRAKSVLAEFWIGRLKGQEAIDLDEAWRRRPLQLHFWRRLEVPLRAETPSAEAMALAMLSCFGVWCFLCYALGCWRLNLCLAWFWQRHLDAGLHAVLHGDFRYDLRLQRGLFLCYSLLCHRAMEYYHGARELQGTGMSKHWWHHIYPNDPGRDPDWSTMTGLVWVRRHHTAQWHPCHRWQSWYWMPVSMFVEPLLELIQVACSLLEAVASVLEPPNGAWCLRLQHLLGLCFEVLFNPGFQLASFLAQPPLKALGTLILAKAVARLLLYPFSEVQHYMPEHMCDTEESEWVVGQLKRTANLEFPNRLAWLLDFLMFHGDSHQIEHHLWPAMSFVQYHRAAPMARAACKDLGLPYHSVGYFEGYCKIYRQVQEHRHPGQPMSKASTGHWTLDS
ncbi:unnamed protein product [Effrenium voratum]|uniref:Cytochrome b5 heme-binding domain-containing protein n=1 Tax=Effrenium voratum TaxID=2562239 RepID=A0AA36JB00_9DINO|nr:unnamed protein product [Effrenium voratum]